MQDGRGIGGKIDNNQPIDENLNGQLIEKNERLQLHQATDSSKNANFICDVCFLDDNIVEYSAKASVKVQMLKTCIKFLISS